MDKPNIVVITSHDTGRHFGCYGVDSVFIPEIDRFAAESVLFTNFFATAAVCAPSRGAMMTGRYPQSNGLMEMPRSANVGRSLFPWDWRYNEGEKHLSQILQETGYHTALIGFQHEAYHSEELGFDEKLVEMVPWTTRYPGEVVADSAVEFLRDNTHSRKPFFAQIGFFETHRPFDFGGTLPDEEGGVDLPPYLEQNDYNIAEVAQLQGAVRKLDLCVGRILDVLRETGLMQETIVVFTVDHGIEFPRAKKFLYDPGIEVALLVSVPGARGGQVCDWLLSNVDLVPTLLALIGFTPPENLEGLSFADCFSGETSASRKEIFGFFQPTGLRCVRTLRYKLIRNFEFRKLLKVPVNAENPRFEKEKCPRVQLFDLAKDPDEVENLVADQEYAKELDDLDRRLWGWLESVNDPILDGPIPTPFYFEGMADYAQYRRNRNS